MLDCKTGNRESKLFKYLNYWLFDVFKLLRSQCFCGNNFGFYGISSDCSIFCANNQLENCGGKSSNSVFLTSCLGI